MRLFFSILVLVIAVHCAGCTILTSDTPNLLASEKRAARGVQYALPKGTVVAKLAVETTSGSFILTLEPGDLIPDPEQEFVLRYVSNPTYEDEIAIRTNDKGLLTAVETTTEDKTPAIIVNVAKAISALGGLEADAVPKQVVQLYQRPFDPFDDVERASVIADIDKHMKAYILANSDACDNLEDEKTAALEKLKNPEKSQKLRPAIDAEKILTPQRKEQAAAVETLRKDKSLVDAAVEASVKTFSSNLLGQYKRQPMTDKSIGYIADDFCKSRKEVTDICDRLEQQGVIAEQLTKAQGALTKTEAALADIEAKRNAQKPQCDAMGALSNLLVEKNERKEPVTKIEIEDEGTWAAAVDGPEPPAVDCTVGICYRPVEPVKLRYSLGAGDETLVVDLPRKNHIVSVDIRRAFFVKKVQKMTFDRGLLTKLEIDKKSELVAISKLPVDVIGAIGEGLKFRVAVTTEEKNLLQREADLLKAQVTLSDARASQSASRAFESASAGGTRQLRGAASPAVKP